MYNQRSQARHYPGEVAENGFNGPVGGSLIKDSYSGTRNPDRFNISTGGKKKGNILQKIEALFPYLQEVMGQNDTRSNQIVSKLVGLRENLDSIF